MILLSRAVLTFSCERDSVSVVAGVRETARRATLDAIKQHARQQLVTEGASGLSLRAIARDLGMVSSAIYRYYDSRDALLTDLIIDAYDAVGSAVETVDEANRSRSTTYRFVAIAEAIRAWAIANTAEYGLVYGTPIPGYVAPADTIGPAIRVSLVLLRLLADGIADGSIVATDTTPTPRVVRTELARLGDIANADIPAPAMARGIQAWMAIFGAVSFELFGHLHNVVDDHDTFFRHSMERLAHFVTTGVAVTT
jgi:AcrR family transcriptional regulator